MNIISNNCLGGFIYRDILHVKYPNPFIWTAITDHNMFLKFCENFDSINFENIKPTIDAFSSHVENRNALLIDDSYTLCFHHVWEDANYAIPTVIKNWGTGINVCCKDPATYIKEKYLERLNRMKRGHIKIFAFYDAGREFSDILKLVDICEKQNSFGIIITSLDLKIGSKNILYLKSDKSWAKGDWAPVILKTFSKDISAFLKSIPS